MAQKTQASSQARQSIPTYLTRNSAFNKLVQRRGSNQSSKAEADVCQGWPHGVCTGLRRWISVNLSETKLPAKRLAVNAFMCCFYPKGLYTHTLRPDINSRLMWTSRCQIPCAVALSFRLGGLAGDGMIPAVEAATIPQGF